MTQDVILKAENLYFSYDEDGQEKALDGLSLEIRRGEKVAVMGSNGSGKSTFFLCCNGIHRPSSGRLYFDGREVTYDRKSLLDLRSQVGIVFQDPDNQLFSASVFQEISFGILNLGASEAQARQEVNRVMEELEITPFRDKPAHALSGGQKKQVSIADILVMHPKLIILDEPAAALDPRHTAMVRKIVDGLTAQGITVLLSTHDVNYAYEWADRVLLFHQGRLLSGGAPEAVLGREDLLEITNLEKPGVLQLYDDLQKAQLLPPQQAMPRNLQQLEEILLRELSPCSGNGK